MADGSRWRRVTPASHEEFQCCVCQVVRPQEEVWHREGWFCVAGEEKGDFVCLPHWGAWGEGELQANTDD